MRYKVMAEKRVFHFNAKIEECEIRGIKDIDNSFKNKQGELVESHHIELMCDYGEDCERIYLIDKDMGNLDKYKRGKIGTFIVRLDVEQDFGMKCKMTIVGFEENKKK
jgi:hypothetical protein